MFSLILCMCTSDTFYILGSHVQLGLHLCRVSAVIFHWSSLLVQCWSMILVCGIFMDFRSNLHPPNEVTNKHMLTRWLMAITFSTSIEAPMIVIDYEYGYVGYGCGEACWIDNQMARIVGYISVAGVVSFMSIILIISTIVTIYRIHNEASGVIQASDARQSHINYVKLTAKLIALVGARVLSSADHQCSLQIGIRICEEF